MTSLVLLSLKLLGDLFVDVECFCYEPSFESVEDVSGVSILAFGSRVSGEEESLKRIKIFKI